MTTRAKHSAKNRHGVSATESADGSTISEYTVLLSLITIIAIWAISNLGGRVIDIFRTLAESIS